MHLVGELVGRMANVELVHVPYKGESQAMMVALKDPDVKSRLEGMGGTVRGSTPDGTRQRVISELARWNKVITEANIPRE